MLEPRRTYGSENVAERTREIDTRNLGAQRIADLGDFQVSSTITG